MLSDKKVSNGDLVFVIPMDKKVVEITKNIDKKNVLNVV